MDDSIPILLYRRNDIINGLWNLNNDLPLRTKEAYKAILAMEHLFRVAIISRTVTTVI